MGRATLFVKDKELSWQLLVKMDYIWVSEKHDFLIAIYYFC